MLNSFKMLGLGGLVLCAAASDASAQWGNRGGRANNAGAYSGYRNGNYGRSAYGSGYGYGNGNGYGNRYGYTPYYSGVTLGLSPLLNGGYGNGYRSNYYTPAYGSGYTTGYGITYSTPSTLSYSTPMQYSTPLQYSTTPTYSVEPAAYTAPALSMPATARADQATISVLLPTADAQVYFGTTEMAASGTDRVYLSPGLEQGKNFTYKVTARWTADGVPVEQVRQIDVKAGGTSTADFRTASLPSPSPRTR